MDIVKASKFVVIDYVAVEIKQGWREKKLRAKSEIIKLIYLKINQ